MGAWEPTLLGRMGGRDNSRLMRSGCFHSEKGGTPVPQGLFLSCRFAITIFHITQCPHGQVSPYWATFRATVRVFSPVTMANPLCSLGKTSATLCGFWVFLGYLHTTLNQRIWWFMALNWDCTCRKGEALGQHGLECPRNFRLATDLPDRGIISAFGDSTATLLIDSHAINL